jgi:hypothetical protein
MITRIDRVMVLRAALLCGLLLVPRTARATVAVRSGIVALAGGASGWTHGYALTAAGEVLCWGEEEFGELGEGSGALGVPACVAGFGDDDGDHLCDSSDVCRNGLGFAPSPKLVRSHFNADPVPGDDKLSFRARFALPPTLAFADLDPRSDGVRLTFVDPGGIVLDRTFPAGAYAGRGTVGWVRNGSGRQWTFTDASAAHGPVQTRLTLSDKCKGASGGTVDLNLLRNDETLPDVPPYVLAATFVPGNAAAAASGTCYQSFLSSCRFNAHQTTLSCTGS